MGEPAGSAVLVSGPFATGSHDVILVLAMSIVPYCAVSVTTSVGRLEAPLRSRSSLTSPPAAVPRRASVAPFSTCRSAFSCQIRFAGSTCTSGTPGQSARMLVGVCVPEET